MADIIITCHHCNGEGSTPTENPCPLCNGSGEIVAEGYHATVRYGIVDLHNNIANLDTKLNALDTKLDTIDAHLDTIENKIDAL